MGEWPEEQIGECRLILGDCREVLPTLGKVDAVVTDPPYGQSFKSGWTGSSIANDGDTSVRDEALAAVSFDRAVVFGGHGITKPAGTRATLIWHRPGSGMGDLDLPWKPDFEDIYIIGSGFTAPKRGDGVLTFAWDVFRGDAGHPHRKPVPLMRHLLERTPGEIVLDPFAGSGSTGVACVNMGRAFIGIEKDSSFFSLMCRRIEAAYAQPDIFIEAAREKPVQQPLFGEAAE